MRCLPLFVVYPCSRALTRKGGDETKKTNGFFLNTTAAVFCPSITPAHSPSVQRQGAEQRVRQVLLSPQVSATAHKACMVADVGGGVGVDGRVYRRILTNHLPLMRRPVSGTPHLSASHHVIPSYFVVLPLNSKYK